MAAATIRTHPPYCSCCVRYDTKVRQVNGIKHNRESVTKKQSVGGTAALNVLEINADGKKTDKYLRMKDGNFVSECSVQAQLQLGI